MGFVFIRIQAHARQDAVALVNPKNPISQSRTPRLRNPIYKSYFTLLKGFWAQGAPLEASLSFMNLFKTILVFTRYDVKTVRSNW